jgi:hypothetical protein
VRQNPTQAFVNDCPGTVDYDHTGHWEGASFHNHISVAATAFGVGSLHVLEDARSSERFCGHKCHFRLAGDQIPALT